MSVNHSNFADYGRYQYISLLFNGLCDILGKLGKGATLSSVPQPDRFPREKIWDTREEIWDTNGRIWPTPRVRLFATDAAVRLGDLLNFRSH